MRVSAILLVGLFTGCAAAEQPAARPAAKPLTPANHRAAAEELLAMMGMDEIMADSIDVMFQAQLQANPSLAPFRDVMDRFFRKYMSWDGLKDDFAALYAESFTQPELYELIAFYETDTGKKALTTLPELMRKGAALGQSRVQAHLPELQEMVAKRAAELAEPNP